MFAEPPEDFLCVFVASDISPISPYDTPALRLPPSIFAVAHAGEVASQILRRVTSATCHILMDSSPVPEKPNLVASTISGKFQQLKEL